MTYLDKHQIEYEENLPYPYVDYQPHFWVLRFSKNENTQKYVCKCFKTSIENYWNQHIKSWESYGENGWEIGYNEGRLGYVNMKYYEQYKEGYMYLDKICHRCNGGILPSITKSLDLYWYKMRIIYTNHKDLISYDKIVEYDKELEDIQKPIDKYHEEYIVEFEKFNPRENPYFNNESWLKRNELQKGSCETGR